MSGIRNSARIGSIRATCGHLTYVVIPGGTSTRLPGLVGQQRINQATTEPCFACRTSKGADKEA